MVAILVPVTVVILLLVILAFFYRHRRGQIVKKRQRSMRQLGIDPVRFSFKFDQKTFSC